MHWADVIAEEIAEKCERPLIATGISPTGLIHVGSLREAITAEAVRSALTSMGSNVRLIYLIDSFDPLRRRYEFLPESFESHVGKPICKIPCPCGKHNNYAHHFVQPFLDAVDAIGVKCEIIWTHELYEKGVFAEAIDLSFRKRKEVMEILKTVSGRDTGENYAPYTPLCPVCGKFVKQPIFESYEYPYVEYDCPCGHHGKADVRKGDGKLTWRLEWPAKWKIFGTSVEPFGKDHNAAGGSYDTGVRIVKEIFGGEAPYPIPYEFVQLKGKGQMHKSTGSSVTGIDAISMTPSEVLNYTFLRVHPERHIDYDSELGILEMADEYDKMETLFFSGEASEKEQDLVRAYEISQHNHVPTKMPLHIPYRHLINVVQMSDSFDGMMRILERTGYLEGATGDDLKRLEQRAECAKYWLNGFAPDLVKFSLCKQMPDTEISADEKKYFTILSDSLSKTDWNADRIHVLITEAATESQLGAKKGFQALYKILIGRTSGPRLGHFLASLEKDFVVRRVKEASR